MIGALTTATKYAAIPKTIQCTVKSAPVCANISTVSPKIFPIIAPKTNIGKNIPPAKPVE